MMPQTAITTTRDPVTPYFTFQEVAADRNDLAFKQILTLRYEVYCLECGYLPEEEFRGGIESDEYDAHSAHFTAYNLGNEVVGTLRLVRSQGLQVFPFEQHCSVFEGTRLPPREESGELSRLVVRKSYRRRTGDSLAGVSRDFLSDPAPDVIHAHADGERRSSSPQILLGLYRQAYLYSLSAGVRYWYAAMEKSLARTLARLGFAFAPIGIETDYYGPVTPYIADLRELEEQVGASNPELLAWFRGEMPPPQGNGCLH